MCNWIKSSSPRVSRGFVTQQGQGASATYKVQAECCMDSIGYYASLTLRISRRVNSSSHDSFYVFCVCHVQVMKSCLILREGE